MHSNQSWPPVISPLGVHPCFRNATRAKQGCCRDWQGHTVFVSIQDTLALIRAIAQVPVLEQLSDPQNKGRQKKIKRQQRSRKHQSKSWDTETQERIRAERAARREMLNN